MSSRSTRSKSKKTLESKAKELPLPYKERANKSSGRINLIDEVSQFKNLKQSKYSAELPNSVVKKDYESWYSHFKDNDKAVLNGNPRSDMSWIDLNYATVYQYIQDKYIDSKHGRKYAPNTKRNHLQSFATVLLQLDKVKYREYIRHIYLKSFEFGDEAKEAVQNQQFDEDEQMNFVQYTELVEKRNQLAELFDKIKSSQQQSNVKTHMQYLVLCLNTMIPPLRLDFLDMEIYRNKKAPPKNEINYLWIKSETDMTIVINQDKVSHHEEKKGLRGEYDLANEIVNKNHGTKITDGMKLMEILNDSLSSLKRDYVLIKLQGYSTKGSEPMPASTYNQSILQALFKPRKPNHNMIRKAYINHFYNLWGTNINDHKAIANRMRHSYATASENYIKLNIDPGMQPQIEGSVIKVPAGPMAPLVIKTQPKFNPTEYSKKYREKNKDKIEQYRKDNYKKDPDKVLARKIIWHLNNNLVKKPQKASIERYKLTFNAKLELWESGII